MNLQQACLATLLISSTAAAQTTLVAHYRLDETSGTVASDSSGNGNHGVYTGAVSLGQAGTCAGSTAVDFDGLSGHVVIPSSPALDALTSDFTVAAWINADVLQLMRVFANERVGGVGGAWAFGPLDGSGALRFTTLGIEDFDQASTLTAGNWHHVAVVFDAAFRVRFYLDGVSPGAIAGGAAANAPNPQWFIGVLDLTGIMEYFDGKIDDVQVYSGVASGAQILSLFQNPCSTIGGPSATSICSGDGGNQMGCTNCPCGNNAMPGTVGGCVNSAGTSSRLIGSGSSSVMAADLRFEASGVAPSNSCVLTSGNALAPANMANPCFGMDSGIQSVSLDGLRCVVQGVLRHGVRPSDANGDVGVTTNGWGTPNGFFQFSAFMVGGTKHFQIIHRDDSGAVCLTGQNTSQAVSTTFTP